MDIVVCVKQVADPEAIVEVDGGGGLSVENKWITGFFDEVAVEQALQLRDQFGGTVTAVTAGTGKAVDALRRAIAMGANEAIMIDDGDLAAADGIGVARALAAVVVDCGADLVLCGKGSLDNEAGAVGPALAEFLDLPHLSEVVQLDATEGSLTVRRSVEGGRSVETCSTPALLTVGKGLVEPRVPPVTGVMKAMRAPIDRRSLADLGLDAAAVASAWRVVGHQPPSSRTAVQIIEGEFPANVDALVATLRDKGVLQ